MVKGRRTEIEFLNGFVVREGAEVGIPARANERLVDIVKRVERGELKQDPRHITELRLTDPNPSPRVRGEGGGPLAHRRCAGPAGARARAPRGARG